MNFQLKGFTLSTGDIWAYQKQRKADGKLNECSLIRHFGERCIVRSMSEQSSVGVLLLRRSEGSHELKMWFHCGMAEMVLCHGELQLQFHIVFILTWQQLSTCYTRFTSAKFFCSFIYAPPLHRPASLKNIYFLDFFCHYFSVSPRQLCFNFLWLKKPFSTSTYSTRLEGTRLGSVLVAFITYECHLMCLGSLHQCSWKSCDAIYMRHTQPYNGGRRRDGIPAARCTAFRQTWGPRCCWFFFFLCSHFQKWRVLWRSRSHDSWSEVSDSPMCGSLSVDTI